MTSEPDVDSSWGDEPDSTSESSESLPDPQYTETEHIHDDDDDWDPTKATEATEATEGFAPASQYTEACAGTQYASAVDYDSASRPPYTESADGAAPFGGEPSPYMPAIVETVQSVRRAEALGELIGKAEYFRAREHNRVLAQSLGAAADAETVLRAVSPALVEVVGEEGAYNNEDGTAEDRDLLDEVPDTMDFDALSLPEMEVLCEIKEPEAAVNIQPLNDPSTLKRKFDEISELLLEERPSAGATESHADIERTAVLEGCSTTPHNRDVAAVITPAVNDRPTKAFRRVAEVFGIAALGGAAVVSALIATAPNF